MGEQTGLARTAYIRERTLANKIFRSSANQGPCGEPLDGPCGINYPRYSEGGPCGDKRKITKMIKTNGAKGSRR